MAPTYIQKRALCAEVIVPGIFSPLPKLVPLFELRQFGVYCEILGFITFHPKIRRMIAVSYFENYSHTFSSFTGKLSWLNRRSEKGEGGSKLRREFAARLACVHTYARTDASYPIFNIAFPSVFIFPP